MTDSGISQASEVPRARPHHYSNLLSRPIAVDGAGENYANWEQDHGGAKSFFVGGFRWFLYASQIDDFRKLTPFGARAVEVVQSQTTWANMPESGSRWNECGGPQFKYARNKEPTFFQKAALIIVACELALNDRLAAKQPTRETITPEDVYKRMSIIPACWHVEEFTAEELRKLRSLSLQAESDLKEAAGQEARTFVEHFTKGYTTTFKTAQITRDHIAKNYKDVRIGRVSPKPGRLLGHLGATSYQTVDTD